MNEDSTLIEVWLKGKLVDSYQTYEKRGGKLSEAFASRRASDYFNRQCAMEAHFEVPEEFDHTDIFNNEPRKPTEQEVDALMAQERLEQDPARKQELRRHILNLMRAQESVAEAIVSHLLET